METDRYFQFAGGLVRVFAEMTSEQIREEELQIQEVRRQAVVAFSQHQEAQARGRNYFNKHYS